MESEFVDDHMLSIAVAVQVQFILLSMSTMKSVSVTGYQDGTPDVFFFY